MARILTVYSEERRAGRLIDMSYIRWQKISEALARCGHQVDMATGEFKWRPGRRGVDIGPRLRRIPLRGVDWGRYDVVKTLFHRGFVTLERRGGHAHPFILSKLGSVVAGEDREGIYFYGARRARMFEIQERIARHSRFVTLLSEPARDLWRECFGTDERVLLVPGAADREIPPPGPDPFGAIPRPRAIFSGNFYSGSARLSQPEAGQAIVHKLNRLGARLRAAGMRLCVVGPGNGRALDARFVDYLGVVDYGRSWDYLYHADAGVLVSAGAFMHNNESTKIYHYVRAGLPFVAERGFPNDDVARDSGIVVHVDPGDLDGMAEALLGVPHRDWDRQRAIGTILDRHTWDHRAAVYDALFRAHLGGPAGATDAGA